MPDEKEYCQNHTDLIKTVSAIEQNVSGLCKSFDALSLKVDKLADSLSESIHSKPSWTISWIITILTSLLFGIIAFVISRNVLG